MAQNSERMDGRLTALLEELLRKIEVQSQKLANYEKNVEAIQQENVCLRSKVGSLQTQLDDVEQYSRMNSLEINGIPEENNEHMVDIIKMVGKVLGIEIEEEHIDACYRLEAIKEGKTRDHRLVYSQVKKRRIPCKKENRTTLRHQ